MKIKKGDHLIYTGPYDSGLPEDVRYSPGIAVAFRNYHETVTVRLDDGSGYADWPITDTAKFVVSDTA